MKHISTLLKNKNNCRKKYRPIFVIVCAIILIFALTACGSLTDYWNDIAKDMSEDAEVTSMNEITNEESTEESTEETKQEVDDVIDNLLEKDNFSDMSDDSQREEIEKLLNNLAEENLIYDVEYDETEKMYSFEYSDGGLGGILMESFSEDCMGAETEDFQIASDGKYMDTAYQQLGYKELNYEINQQISAAKSKKIDAKVKILILYTLGEKYETYYQDFDEYWGTDLTDVDIVYDCTVDDLKNMSGYDIYIFAGHGTIYRNEPVLVLQKKYKVFAYQSDYKKQNIAKLLCKDDNGKYVRKYAVLGSFFTDNYVSGDFDNSIIEIQSCKFYGCDCRGSDIDYEYANVFLELAAEAVVGFRNSVMGQYSMDITNNIITYMLNGNSIQKALEQSIKDYGETDNRERLDDDKHKAYPILCGNRNFQFDVGNADTTENITDITTEAIESKKEEETITDEDTTMQEELFNQVLKDFYTYLAKQSTFELGSKYNIHMESLDDSEDGLQLFSYTYKDVTGDGIDELWIYSEEKSFSAWFTIRNGKACILNTDSSYPINSYVEMWYCKEDGSFLRIRMVAGNSTGYEYYTLYRLNENSNGLNAEEELILKHNDVFSSEDWDTSETDRYLNKDFDGETINDKPLTEEEAEDLINSYTAGIYWYPDSGYSFSDYQPWE